MSTFNERSSVNTHKFSQKYEVGDWRKQSYSLWTWEIQRRHRPSPKRPTLPIFSGWELLPNISAADIEHLERLSRTRRILTPQLWAASVGNTHMLEALVQSEFGIDRYAEHVSGQSPLHTAIRGAHTETVKTLLERQDIDINSRDLSERTPLHLVIGTRNALVSRAILKAETVDLNAQDATGQTPLSLAVSGRDDSVVKTILGSSVRYGT